MRNCEVKTILRAYRRNIMFVRFTKLRDGFALTFLRADGTSTTAKPKSGAVFINHDLMHYCVETTLGFTQAFYGLLAGGRSIESFNKQGRGMTLPDEAAHAEFIIGAIQLRQGWDGALDADEINAEIVQSLENARGNRTPPAPLTQVQVDSIVKQHNELTSAFATLNVGEYLELPFPKTA